MSIPLGIDPRFQDRHHAGRVLARWLLAYTDRPDVIIQALPLAAAVAEALALPFAVRDRHV